MATTTPTTTFINVVNIFSEKTSQTAQTVGTKAASDGFNFLHSFSAIDWAHPTWDVILLVLFVLTAIIYIFALGRDRVVTILLSTYLALAVATNLPYQDTINTALKNSGFFAYQTSAFVLLFVVIFFFLSRSQLLQGIYVGGGSWWHILVFSLLQIGLLTSIILSFLPTQLLNQLAQSTRDIFLSDIGRFCWMILPILALIFIQGRPRRRRGLMGRIDDLGM